METLKGSAVKKALWTAVENAGGTVSGWKAAPGLGGFEGRSGGRFSFVVTGEDVGDRAFQDRVKQAVTRVLTGWAPKGDHVAAAVASAVWGPPKDDGLTLVVQLPGGVQLEDRAMTMSGLLERVETRLHEAKEMAPRELIDKGDNLVKLLESAVEDVRKAVAAAQAELKGYARIGVPERAASVLLKKHLLPPAERLEDMAKKVRETIEEGIKVFS